MWHCSRASQPVSQASHHHHQELPASEVYPQFLRVSAEPSAALESSIWGRLGTCFPGFRSRAESCRRTEGSAAHDHHHPLPNQRGTRRKKGARLCHPTRRREAGAPRAGREIAARPARAEAPKAISATLRCADSAPGAQGVGRERNCPDPASPRLGLHGSRALQQPRRAGPGRAARGAPRPAGDVDLRLPLAPRDPPETPEESCAARGPERRPPRAPPLTAPRRGFVLSGVASPASAQAPEPPPGPLTPGRPAPSERSPQRARRALGAGGRRATGCAAAASGGATASRAGGWVRGVGEGGGGRDAAGAEAGVEGGGNRNVTRARGGENGEGETGDPPPTPDPDLRPAPPSSPPPLGGLLAGRCVRPSSPLGPHALLPSTHPCLASPLWLRVALVSKRPTSFGFDSERYFWRPRRGRS